MSLSIEDQYNNLVSKWNKSLLKETISLKKEIIDIAKSIKAAANGKFAYDMYTKSDDDEIINDNVLTYFVKKSIHYDMIKKISKLNVVIGELNIDENTKDIKYAVPHTGLNDPYMVVIAKIYIISDNFDLRINTISTRGYIVAPDYLFIDWYDKVSQPRETKSLEQWADIHEKNIVFQKMFIKEPKKINENDNSRRIPELEKYFEGNKNLIIVGDYAINKLLNTELPFRTYKILVMTRDINKIRDEIHMILKKFGWKYTFIQSFLLRYHGPETIFHKDSDVILRIYQSSEQCIPFFNYKNLQIARIPNILKYLYLDPQTDKRDYLIYKVFTAMNEYYKTYKLTPFDPSPFMFYDVNCLGEYTSSIRKKRIKLYKARIHMKGGTQYNDEDIIGIINKTKVELPLEANSDETINVGMGGLHKNAIPIVTNGIATCMGIGTHIKGINYFSHASPIDYSSNKASNLIDKWETLLTNNKNDINSIYLYTPMSTIPDKSLPFLIMLNNLELIDKTILVSTTVLDPLSGLETDPFNINFKVGISNDGPFGYVIN